jgi:hypothetical protein
LIGLLKLSNREDKQNVQQEDGCTVEFNHLGNTDGIFVCSGFAILACHDCEVESIEYKEHPINHVGLSLSKKEQHYSNCNNEVNLLGDVLESDVNEVAVSNGISDLLLANSD